MNETTQQQSKSRSARYSKFLEITRDLAFHASMNHQGDSIDAYSAANLLEEIANTHIRCKIMKGFRIMLYARDVIARYPVRGAAILKASYCHYEHSKDEGEYIIDVNDLIKIFKEPVNTFQLMLQYLNDLRIGQTFSRAKLLQELRINKGSDATNNTIDNYRNYFKQAGYIETVRRGHYKLLAKPFLGMSSSTLFEEAYKQVDEPNDFMKE